MFLLKHLSQQEKKLIQKKNMPSFVTPMMAKLTKNYFSNPDWLFETKIDGIRCLIFKKNKTVILKSRNDKILNEQFPEIVTIVKNLDLPDCILDGEVAVMKDKKTSFSELQKYSLLPDLLNKAKKQALYCYVFDIIYCEGYDITQLPLIMRKSLLKILMPSQGCVLYLPHQIEKGEFYYKQACKNQLEGVIAKRIDSTYTFSRSSNWLKFKCVNQQEFVIGGYTKPTGLRTSFGALLLGYYDNQKLYYAGKVGTGFDERTLLSLGALLKKHERKTNPFADYNESLRGVHWVKPLLVCQIRFAQWTDASRLRHATFLGLRDDKSPLEVKREG